jgi:hypothetical protein
MLSVKPSLNGTNDLRFGRKIANFQSLFTVNTTVRSTTGPDPENRVGDQETGSPGKPVSSGLQTTGEPGCFSARTKPIGHPEAFFMQNCFQLPQKRLVILRVDSLTLLKISNKEDAALIQKIKERCF